jgi:hypothetical protein
LGESLAGISGKSGQLPARAINAFNRRACAAGSLTVNPSVVLTNITVFEESLNAFGKRTAWEFPDLNTLAVAVVMRIYGRYGIDFVKQWVKASGFANSASLSLLLTNPTLWILTANAW